MAVAFPFVLSLHSIEVSDDPSVLENCGLIDGHAVPVKIRWAGAGPNLAAPKFKRSEPACDRLASRPTYFSKAGAPRLDGEEQGTSATIGFIVMSAARVVNVISARSTAATLKSAQFAVKVRIIE